ncbi:MAG: SirB2 family protein [Granulosicoccaceae bacterium]
MIETYPLIKQLHMSLAVISVTGFALRFVWMLCGSALIEHRLSKVLPHVVDTFLLLSGLTLAYTLKLSPLAVPWLGLKLILLLVYIVLGTLALKRAPNRPLKLLSFVGALLAFAQMLGVAINHSPWGLLD